MLAGAGPRHVVHLADHLVDGAVGDHHHPGRVVGHREVGQQFADEFDLIVKVLCSNRGARVYQEHKVCLDAWENKSDKL